MWSKLFHRKGGDTFQIWFHLTVVIVKVLGLLQEFTFGKSHQIRIPTLYEQLLCALVTGTETRDQAGKVGRQAQRQAQRQRVTPSYNSTLSFFTAIRSHSPAKPVLIFVSSRRQTRLTALDLIAYLATEDDPKQWLHQDEREVRHEIPI